MKKKKNNNEYFIEIKNLNKSYSSGNKTNKIVFNNFNINFEKNKTHCILGVSGCGKSTLLRIIANLETYQNGKIKFNEKKDDVFLSMIMQENNLLPWLTVYKNIEFVLNASKNGELQKEDIIKVLKKYNLLEYKDFYPYELSVGLKQKVSLAKALFIKPSLILLDESFSALDFVSKTKIHNMFLNEYSKQKFTSILSTHSIEEAIKLGDYIHLLGKGNTYKKIVNPLKKPRDKDIKYHEFLDFIKKEYV